jgi:hypothetical protein
MSLDRLTPTKFQSWSIVGMLHHSFPTASPALLFGCKISLDRQKHPSYTFTHRKHYLINSIGAPVRRGPPVSIRLSFLRHPVSPRQRIQHPAAPRPPRELSRRRKTAIIFSLSIYPCCNFYCPYPFYGINMHRLCIVRKGRS